MLLFALALAAPTSLTDMHQRDIACVVEVAILADEQKRGVPSNTVFPDVTISGKRWIGLIGAQIVEESGQPREIVAFAMAEAAKARQTTRRSAIDLGACIVQMFSELKIADAVNAPLPKPVKAQ